MNTARLAVHTISTEADLQALEPEWNVLERTTLLSEMVQYAFAGGLTSVNLSTGNDVAKSRWSPRKGVEYSAVMKSTRPMGRLVHGVYQLVDRTLHSYEVRDYARALFLREGGEVAPAADQSLRLEMSRPATS
jgi:CelD/BcsL family acetyltransferase involved in cellulose biosynthesis